MPTLWFIGQHLCRNGREKILPTKYPLHLSAMAVVSYPRNMKLNNTQAMNRNGNGLWNDIDKLVLAYLFILLLS
jgi:hypothetical protein